MHAQVALGTVYVFNCQMVQEMLVIYSFGSLELYRRLVFLSLCAFAAAGAFGGTAALVMYESYERKTLAFQVVALMTAACACVCATFYALRLRRVRLADGLAAAEVHLLRKRRESVQYRSATLR